MKPQSIVQKMNRENVSNCLKQIVSHQLLPMSEQFIKFRSDNFTEYIRTPWAGCRIAQTLKSGLGLALPSRIGESWEFSTSAELPSRCTGTFEGTFSDFLRNGKHSLQWLSDSHRKVWGNQSPLLVKYIDAAENLSLQLHPPIETSCLSSFESGKWESWLVLRHSSNSGIFLGLECGVSKEEFIDTIHYGGDVQSLLHFVPVHTGELYVIPPRTIHTLGAGVCVLEPQMMQPGKKAVSLRLHDWNRKYDAHGNVSESGKPRELHLEEALKFIDFDAPRGKELEKLNRVEPIIILDNHEFRVVEFSLIPYLKAQVLSGTGTYFEEPSHELEVILAMQGHVCVTVDNVSYELSAGESAAIAASAKQVILQCRKANVYRAHCLPALFSK